MHPGSFVWRSPERRSAAVMRRLRSFFAGMIRESRIIIANLPVGTGVCLNAGKLGFEKCVDAILAQMNVMGIK